MKQCYSVGAKGKAGAILGVIVLYCLVVGKARDLYRAIWGRWVAGADGTAVLVRWSKARRMGISLSCTTACS